jgi:hypothetical protein
MYKNIQNENTQNSSQVWYTHYRGYIIKNWIEKDTNRIIQEKIEYNQPDNYLKYLDNYFRYKLN